MHREARVQRALAGTVVPVPTIVLEDAGGILGVPFYVMRKVPGLVVSGALPGDYATTPAERLANSARAYPRRVHFVGELSTTPGGKVQRYLLRRAPSGTSQ